jgi:hypothetical protein
MSFDLLEKLRDVEVPEAPAGIDEQVHQRLNTSLAITHLVEFVGLALPHAMAEFGRPLGDLLRQTLAIPPKKDDRGSGKR